MSTHDTTGLGEAFASYQPSLLSPEQWAHYRDDAITLIGQFRESDVRQARYRMSRLVRFIAHAGPARPDAPIAALLTRADVDGYLAAPQSAGRAPNTIENDRATLNKLLDVVAGRPIRRRQRRASEPHLAPYSEAQVTRWLATAAEHDDEHAQTYARLLACILAGVIPSTLSAAIHVEVARGDVQVGDRSWDAPAGLPLPASGTLDPQAIPAARTWVRDELGLRADKRRLELTAITMLAATGPALDVLRLPGLGRDRLTGAYSAAPRPNPEEVERLLRG